MKSKTDGDLSLKIYWKNTAFLSQKIAIGRFRKVTNTDSKHVQQCVSMTIISEKSQAVWICPSQRLHQ